MTLQHAHRVHSSEVLHILHHAVQGAPGYHAYYVHYSDLMIGNDATVAPLVAMAYGRDSRSSELPIRLFRIQLFCIKEFQ